MLSLKQLVLDKSSLELWTDLQREEKSPANSQKPGGPLGDNSKMLASMQTAEHVLP